MSIFEKAARLKLRFETANGSRTVEDLWDLPLKSAAGRANLDAIAVDLFSKLQRETPISFVDPDAKSSSNELIKLQFDVVKHIIDVKKAEKKQHEEMTAARQADQTIMGIIAEKEHSDLRNLPVDELRKRLSSAKTAETV